MDVEESNSDMIWGTIPASTWRNEENKKKPQSIFELRTPGCEAEMETIGPQYSVINMKNETQSV
jgi:hypothetical protein